ncbi:TfoX/Sxy family DNA transformation protein [Enterococcus faecalis]
MSDLINLPNIGVVLEKKLLLAGIENQEKLKKTGVKKLFFVYDCKVTQMHVYICFMGWKEQ